MWELQLHGNNGCSLYYLTDGKIMFQIKFEILHQDFKVYLWPRHGSLITFKTKMLLEISVNNVKCDCRVCCSKKALKGSQQFLIPSLPHPPAEQNHTADSSTFPLVSSRHVSPAAPRSAFYLSLGIRATGGEEEREGEWRGAGVSWRGEEEE